MTTPVDKQTDLTGGQLGIPNEYAGTPVQQGELHEVTDSKWLQQPVHGKQDEIVGKIKQVFTDQKTGEIEYVILVPSGAVGLGRREQGQGDQLTRSLQDELGMASKSILPVLTGAWVRRKRRILIASGRRLTRLPAANHHGVG